MDPRNPYSMAKLSLEAKDNLRPQRDCGFYLKYFFLFLSLIQFLIILGLVLFMIYGSPQAGNEKNLQGVTSLLQKAEAKVEAQGKEVGELKRKLNASQTETALIRRQATMLNISGRSCTNDKAQMAEYQKNLVAYFQARQESFYQLQILNMTCPPKVTSLEDQLKVAQLQAQMDRDRFARESLALQEKARLGEQEKQACLSDKLQLQKQEEKHRELESKVMATLEPVQQSLALAVDQALSPNKFGGCYHSEISNMRETCRNLGGTLQSQLSALARQLDQKVKEVAQENGRLQSQKETCAHDVQERDRRLGAQQQQAERDKQALRETHAAETKKMAEEQQKLAREKDELAGQLEQSKQACLRTRLNAMPSVNFPGRYPGFPASSGGANPFASFPGSSTNFGGLGPGGAPAIPNAYGGQPLHWPRPGQPSLASQGSPSQADRMRLQETRKDPPEIVKMQNQPPLGKPSA